MRNFLGIIGLVLVIIGLILAAYLVYMVIEDPSQFNIPDLGSPAIVGQPSVVVVQPQGDTGGVPTWTPRPGMPPTAVPAPTATPLPDPVAYRTTVLVRARYFAITLEAFMGVNERLQGNQGLIGDPAWRSEVMATLDEFVSASHALADAGTVPPEYQDIQGWLDQVGPEADLLRENYRVAVETGDEQRFREVGDNLNNIITFMTQAELAMVTAGWPAQPNLP